MSQLNSILELVAPELLKVNQLIKSSVCSDVPLVSSIGEHILDCGGKRIRPIICLLTAKACGYTEEEHIELATAIEFIHTATLLHDDVIDKACQRRGVISANVKWGNAPAVLVGDFLYSRSFQILVKIGKMPIMNIIADATNCIAEGEVLQLSQQNNPEITHESYYEIIYRKTAKLFEASAQVAATISNLPINLVDSITVFGKELGLAYQLIDDALDLTVNNKIGKDHNHDIYEGKFTLPIIRTMQFANNDEVNFIKSVAVNPSPSKNDLDHVIELARKYDSINYVIEQAKQHAHNAKLAIAELPNNEYVQALTDLASFIVERDY